MKFCFRICLASALLCTFAPIMNAQKSLSVDCTIEQAVREKEPGWNLAEVFVRKSSEEDYVRFQWKYNLELTFAQAPENEVSARVNEYESSSKAAEVLHHRVMMISVGSYSKAEGIGDEAFVLDINSFRKEFSTSRILFRRGRVVIELETPSVEVAKHFAQSIADSLPRI